MRIIFDFCIKMTEWKILKYHQEVCMFEGEGKVGGWTTGQFHSSVVSDT